MKYIPLTQDKVALVSDEDYDRVMEHKWCASWREDTRSFVAMSWIGGKPVYLHHFVLGLRGAARIDHVNHETLDNQRENLRPATRSQNAANMRKQTGTSSKYKGVCWPKHTRKWAAYIKVDYKRTHLGLYETEDAAARAYDAAVLDAWGEFAQLNFPVGGA